MVIGNKIDLRDDIVISMNRGEEFAKKFNAAFFETSAANDLNVTLAFDDLLGKLLIDEREERESCCVGCKCQ
jgi:GTPase SAR1 family protein